MDAFTPDVVDGNSIAWATFTASLDIRQLELERVVGSSVSAEVAAHELQQERFGSRRHHEMVWRHEVTRMRSRAVIASQRLPVWFSEKQLQIAADAIANATETSVRGFAKGHTGDVTASSGSRAPQPTKASEKAHGKDAA